MLDVTQLQNEIKAFLDARNVDGAMKLLYEKGKQDPNDPRYSYYQGDILKKEGHIDAAISVLVDLVQRFPGFVPPYLLLGQIYDDRGENAIAFGYWSLIFQNNANLHAQAIGSLLKCPETDSQMLLDIAVDWGRRYGKLSNTTGGFSFRPYDGERIIKVGYICNFWTADTIRAQLLPMARRHDRSAFKVYAYNWREVDHDISDCVDVFRSYGVRNDEELVEYIRADEIDILVEVSGFIPGNRFAALAGRCAPVQISYLNHTATTGTPNIDYVLTDAVCTPDYEERYFTEKLYRLPRCFFCFNYEDMPTPEPGPCPFEKNGYITFGCFGSGSKINEVLIDWWARILRRIPNGKLYLRNKELDAADNRKYMSQRFEQLGIPSNRLIIEAGTDRAGILKSYGEIDIALDTYPFCGGNTTAESFWQGVPVITCRGNRFSSAYGASLIMAAGCQELVANSPEEYVNIAVALAGNQERLRFYRRSLRKMSHEYGLSDADGMTKALENAYREMLLRVGQARHRTDPAGRLRSAIRRSSMNVTIQPESRDTKSLMEVLKALLRHHPIETVFDVGAHWGESAASFVAAFPAATVHSFEPFGESFQRLAATTVHFQRIRAYKLGMSDNPGIQPFFASEETVLNSLLPVASEWLWKSNPLHQSENIEVTTLDTFCQTNVIPRIDILKVDVQGAEARVLKGAKTLLEQGAIRAIRLEVLFFDMYQGQASLDELFRMLTDFGYQFCGMYEEFIDPHGRLLWADVLFVHRTEFASLPKPSL